MKTAEGTQPPETQMNARGQWRRPPNPEAMAERISAFAKKWTNYSRLTARTQGVLFVKACWPDVELLDDAERLLGTMQTLGARGIEYPGTLIHGLCQRMPYHPINAGRLFAFFTHRQWQIGRGRLMKKLAREHGSEPAPSSISELPGKAPGDG